MDLTDFSMPVHKSFHQADLLLGIPKTIFMLLFLIFVLSAYLFGFVVAIPVVLLIYIPSFILTKHDPFMLSIALNSLIEPDRLEG
ncbi:MAG: VirB3 family type IV secretion system protein [Butyrivibrio sp.]|nr:VirB3 family type IV secretion system protein [Butyrivibrio sp.]